MDISLENYITILHSCLSKDLLKKQYKDDYENLHFTTGHCYIASEAIFHNFGGKEKWAAYTGRDHNNGTHWWLKNKETGEIIDPTKEQYTSLNIPPPYDKGRPCAFLTKEPSQRAKRLISLIDNKIEEYNKLREDILKIQKKESKLKF